jgi:hypothetical protein
MAEVKVDRDWNAEIPLTDVNYNASWDKVEIPYLEKMKSDEQCYFTGPQRSRFNGIVTVFYAVRWFPSLSRSFVELKIEGRRFEKSQIPTKTYPASKAFQYR